MIYNNHVPCFNNKFISGLFIRHVSFVLFYKLFSMFSLRLVIFNISEKCHRCFLTLECLVTNLAKRSC